MKTKTKRLKNQKKSTLLFYKVLYLTVLYINSSGASKWHS